MWKKLCLVKQLAAISDGYKRFLIQAHMVISEFVHFMDFMALPM
jgi:hypothetical protein